MTIEAPPVSRLTATRERLVDALEGSGIRTAVGGRFAAPAILVEPAEPWIDRDTPSTRLQARWKLTAIAGRSDTAAAYDQLALLIDQVDTALLSLRGVSLPTWGAPHDLTLGNVAHPASVATVLMHSEV
jgi:hypothetical protein